MPALFQKDITAFEELLVVRILKPEMVHSAITRYLDKQLGSKFTISPSATVGSLFEAADNITPIIFVLS